MIDFGIELEGLEPLRRGMKRFGAEIGEGLRQAMRYSLGIIASEAKPHTPVDMGRLRASIGASTAEGIHEVKSLGVDIVGRVGTRVIYAPPVELGRRPGARMPPPTAIEEWAGRHGMAGMGFVIARAIGRRGIKGAKMLENAARAKAPQVVKTFEQKVAELIRRLRL